MHANTTIKVLFALGCGIGLITYDCIGSIMDSFFVAVAVVIVLYVKYVPKNGTAKNQKLSYRIVNHRFGWKWLEKHVFLWSYFRIFPKWSIYCHGLLAGQSGSGKSELAKLELYGMIHKKYTGSIVYFDAHGDVSQEIAQFKYFQESPDKLVYISGEFLDAGKTVCINPLEHSLHDLPPHIRYRRLSMKVQELVQSFEALFRDGGLTHHMQNLLKHAFWLLLEEPHPCLLDLIELTTPKHREKFIEMSRSHSLPQVRDYFSNVYPDPKLDISMYAINGRLSNIFDGFAVRQFLGARKSTIDLDSLLNANKVIVFNISQSRFGIDGTRIVGAFLLSMIGDFALRRAETAFRPPVKVFLDEAPLYVTSSLQKYLDEARKYQTYFTAMVQRTSQLSGQSLAMLKEAVLSSGVRRIGSSPIDELNKVSKEMGVETQGIRARLHSGTLLMQSGKQKPILYTAPSFLLKKKSYLCYMDEAAFENIKQEQLASHYIDFLKQPNNSTMSTTETNPSIPSLL